jgi:NitT/TauT family transport system substrate-binding protein
MAAAVVLPLSSAAAEPVKLRVNYSVVPPHMVPVLAQKADLFKHRGKSYTTEFIFTTGSAIVLQAMAAREMDLGVLTTPPFVNGIVNGKQPLVAIADLTQDGPWFSAIFAVRDDSPVKSVKDLKGKTVASIPAGSGLDGALRAMLLKHGLQPDRDVRIVEAGFGAMEAMLRQGKVELSILTAPFWERAKQKGGLRVLFTMKDVVGDNQHLFWAARRDFLQKNEAVLVDFFEDYIRAQRWMLKPENRKEVLDMVAKFTKRPASDFEWEFKEGTGYYRMPDLRLNRQVFQRTADALAEVGFLPKFDTAPHIDETVIRKAAERLGGS